MNSVYFTIHGARLLLVLYILEHLTQKESGRRVAILEFRSNDFKAVPSSLISPPPQLRPEEHVKQQITN